MEPGPAKHAARSRVLRQGTLVVAAYAVGLLASCAVAWAISAYYAWKPPPPWATTIGRNLSSYSGGWAPEYDFTVDGVPGTFALRTAFGFQNCVVARAEWPPTNARPIPRWAVIDLTPGVCISTEARGWPALCLGYCRVATSRRAGPNMVTTITERHSVATPLVGPSSHLTLPLAPIATGLAINTALYGSLVLAGLCLPGWAHRAIRRRRGRCTACGYDRRGLTGEPCPECGHTQNPQLPTPG